MDHSSEVMIHGKIIGVTYRGTDLSYGLANAFEEMEATENELIKKGYEPVGVPMVFPDEMLIQKFVKRS